MQKIVEYNKFCGCHANFKIYLNDAIITYEIKRKYF